MSSIWFVFLMFAANVIFSAVEKKVTKKTACLDSKTGNKVLRYSLFYCVISIVVVLLGIFLVVIAVYTPPKDLGIKVVTFSLIGLTFFVGLFMTIQSFWSKVYFNNQGIFSVSLFKKCGIEWKEIKEINFKSITKTYALTSIQGHKIEINDMLNGWQEFVNEMQRFAPHITVNYK